MNFDLFLRDFRGLFRVTDLLRSQDGRYRRQVSCLWWWLYWALGPAGWGLWRSFLCGKHRIPWRAGHETPPTDPAGLPQGQHTESIRKHRINTVCQKQTFLCCLCWYVNRTLAKLAVKSTHSKSSPIFWRNSSTWGLFSTYTWNTQTHTIFTPGKKASDKFLFVSFVIITLIEISLHWSHIAFTAWCWPTLQVEI